MGLAMARNLVGAGFAVSGWARRQETVDRGRAGGVEMRPTLAEVGAASDVVVTMVTSSTDVIEVAIGKPGAGGLLDSMAQGSVLVDMSTIAPGVSRQVAAVAAGHGVGFLDAPVSGGSFGAEQGTLTIMAGGDAAVLERCRPVFAAIGDPDRLFHTGPVGSGEVAKLVNNMLVGSISAATLEALVVGVRAGVSLKTLVDVVSVSSGGSAQLTGQLAKRALVGELDPGFATELLLKDLRLAAELATEQGQQTPLTDVARQMFEASQAAGHGRQDYTALAVELARGLSQELKL
jgi:3-hydroxyisobutyrate dehydrogenase-like beta-hydroxyacid dehydrogenase